MLIATPTAAPAGLSSSQQLGLGLGIGLTLALFLAVVAAHSAGLVCSRGGSAAKHLHVAAAREGEAPAAAAAVL